MCDSLSFLNVCGTAPRPFHLETGVTDSCISGIHTTRPSLLNRLNSTTSCKIAKQISSLEQTLTDNAATLQQICPEKTFQQESKLREQCPEQQNGGNQTPEATLKNNPGTSHFAIVRRFKRAVKIPYQERTRTKSPITLAKYYDLQPMCGLSRRKTILKTKRTRSLTCPPFLSPKIGHQGQVRMFVTGDAPAICKRRNGQEKKENQSEH